MIHTSIFSLNLEVYYAHTSLMLLGNENGNERQNNVVSFTVDSRNKKFGTDLERMQNGKETRAAIEYWFDLLRLSLEIDVL